jgi:rRNA small subunit aminocarboxypropyltransferase
VDVLILRDGREAAAKCSLTPLRGLAGLRFQSWRPEERYAVGKRVLLHPEGELLSAADAGCDLLLLDCAWRRVPLMLASLDGEVALRRLPQLQTAYPRRSKLFQDPNEGLASVEALYAALALLGAPRRDLLDGYRWRDAFLSANPGLA